MRLIKALLILFCGIRSESIIVTQTKTSSVFVPDIAKRSLMNNILLTSVFGSCGP